MKSAAVLPVVVALLAIVLPGSGEPAESRPDIVVVRWSTPSTAPSGGAITVVVHLVNSGQAPSSRFANELRLDPPVPGSAPIQPARWETEPLNPGQSVKAEVNLPVPSTALPGAYVLRVIADASSVVAEDNEYNNLAERRLIVTAPRGPTPSPKR